MTKDRAMASFLPRLFLLLCVVVAVSGDCYDGPLHTRWNGGRLEKYCLTKEIRPETVPYGGRLDSRDCYRCSCGQRGLHCCGFGIKAGSNADDVPMPDHCTLVIKGCDYYYVDRYTRGPCRRK